jgi:hypothetical protein
MATTTGTGMTEALAVADAILYEGYLLYPYRHSSAKNRVRWQFGVLVPPEWGHAHGLGGGGLSGAEESWWQRTECLMEGGDRVDIRLRFLHVQTRDAASSAVDLVSGFDEAVPVEIDLSMDSAMLDEGRRTPLHIPGAEVNDGGISRRRAGLTAMVTASAEPAGAPFGLRRLRVLVENTVDDLAADAPRPECLRHSLVATHALITVHNGRFLSLIDPPAWATPAARQSRNEYAFPVLAGPGGTDGLVLSSPVILYDHPRIAPESPADLHDATEIDEILTLRVLTLSDAERLEVRRTDPRVAAILDRVESMPPEALGRLHGAIRTLGADAGPPQPHSAGGFGPGTRVRLLPRVRGTDAHDMFLAGRTASVVEVLHDVDGTEFLAVTVDDDPGAELHQWYGRTRHFRLDEVVPLDVAEPGPGRTS